jgi:hypothetical protein
MAPIVCGGSTPEGYARLYATAADVCQRPRDSSPLLLKESASVCSPALCVVLPSRLRPCASVPSSAWHMGTWAHRMGAWAHCGRRCTRISLTPSVRVRVRALAS